MNKSELNELLKRNASNQEKLAKGLGIPKSTVNKWAQRDAVPEGWARYLRLLDSLAMLKTQQSNSKGDRG